MIRQQTIQQHAITDDSYQQLYQHGLEMLSEAFNLPHPVLRAGLNVLLQTPAHHVTRTALRFDALTAQHDTLREASRWLVREYTRSLTVTGIAHVPADGPVIIASNHPGIVDMMAVYDQLPRVDVRPIAKTRKLLQLLPHVRQQLIFVGDDTALSTLRHAIQHLQAGGALLTFPRGEIEPDPALYPTKALHSLGGWSASLDVLARYVPDVVIIPAVVRGVISESAQRHLLARLYQDRAARDYVAATLQIIQPRYSDTHVRVQFGKSLHGNHATTANTRQTIADLMCQPL
jgi:hypothetical protein